MLLEQNWSRFCDASLTTANPKVLQKRGGINTILFSLTQERKFEQFTLFYETGGWNVSPPPPLQVSNVVIQNVLQFELIYD